VNCESCLYYMRSASLSEVNTMPSGWCKRHPTAIATNDLNWCGDFRYWNGDKASVEALKGKHDRPDP
jgi:hypothetical protein